MTIDEAKAYTGDPKYWGISGETQLALLKNEGLKSNHSVLEVGCGSLNAGIPLINYLDEGKYTGLEPKKELVEVVKNLIDIKKNPVFFFNRHYEVDEQYDYVIGHSVFSHAPQWQFLQFLHNVKGEKMYLSLHLVEDNPIDVFWLDKGNTYYEIEWIEYYAKRFGYEAEEREDLKEYFMERIPPDYHDWIQLIKT
jgi:SAM-dependent methyltransferase